VSFYLHTSTYYLLYAYHLRRFCRFILQGFHWELLQGEGSLEGLIPVLPERGSGSGKREHIFQKMVGSEASPERLYIYSKENM
jgi:hypothetical protein